MRYASRHNFVEEQLYPCARCLLRPEMAAGLLKAEAAVKEQGYFLKVFDCYRPGKIQQKLWKKFPNPSYVTPPWKGSNHNRGLAVDIGLVDSCGVEWDMGSPFDHLGKTSHHDYLELGKDVLHRRKVLKTAMEQAGFSAIRTEWWHYNYYRVKYPVEEWIWECQ